MDRPKLSKYTNLKWYAKDDSGVYTVEPKNAGDDIRAAALEALKLAQDYPQYRIMIKLHDRHSVDVNASDTVSQQIIDRWYAAQEEARKQKPGTTGLQR